jgi:hypothetical protein
MLCCYISILYVMSLYCVMLCLLLCYLVSLDYVVLCYVSMLCFVTSYTVLFYVSDVLCYVFILCYISIVCCVMSLYCYVMSLQLCLFVLSFSLYCVVSVYSVICPHLLASSLPSLYPYNKQKQTFSQKEYVGAYDQIITCTFQ